MTERANVVSDEELVAYLDDELSRVERSAIESRLNADPGARVRLEYLRAGDRPFAEAFDAVLRAAPSERLQDILREAARGQREPKFGRALRVDRRLAAIAAAIVLFVGGALVGANLPGVAPISESESESLDTPDGWRAVVTDYLNLYTRDTLADMPDDPALLDKQLAFVSAKLSLDLSPEKVALPDLALKRSQVFALGGKPLAQIVYLPMDGGPLAFCIISSGDSAEQSQTFESRQGRNIVYWSKAGHKFMLVGDLPKSQLEPLATSLAARVS
jgi:anti-sigma factor RsiW